MLVQIFLLVSFALSASAQLQYQLPFHTASGPNIWSADNKRVQLVGTNWPGHLEPMIPEGLQYASVKDTVSKIKALGLNVVRLTYATEMIDDILDRGGDVTLQTTLTRALGSTNGTAILNRIRTRNPQFTAQTTRLQIFDAVAKELGAQGIYVHLDNHVSKASWCCGTGDGNAWFGDTHFDVQRWIRGWSYISQHAAANWPTFSSVSLRNELRQPDNGRGQPYDWYTWYVYMTQAAAAVYKAAPEALIYFSGLSYDTIIGAIPLGRPLNGTSGTSSAGKVANFDPRALAYTSRIVLEIHKYDFEKTQITCDAFARQLINAGYSSVNTTDPAVKYRFPILLTEWGFIQDGSYWSQTTYNKCLIEFMGKWKPSGWMQWAIGGSYYIRRWRGIQPQDDDETWGLLNHNWSGIRSQSTVDNSLKKMVAATLG